jgi:peptide/nickel transport system permease protein
MIAPLMRPVALLGQFVLLALLGLFLLARSVPGGPVAWLAGPAASTGERSALATTLAVDRAAHVQFLRFSRRVVSGDLGRSARSGAPVLPVVATAVAGTGALLLAAGAVAAPIVSLLVGGLTAFGIGGRMIAAFALAGLMAQVPLAVAMAHWSAEMAMLPAALPPALAPFVALLPGIALLALLVAGVMTLDLRRLLRERMASPSALMARARGFGRWSILRRQAMPSVLPQLGRAMIVALPRLLGLTLLVEALVTGTGLGALTFTALANRDVPMLAGAVLILLALGLLLRALVSTAPSFRWRSAR